MRWARLAAVLLGAALPAAVLAAACSSPAQAQKPLTYVAIGASDAVGIGAQNPEVEGWVPRLGASLGPSVRVINLGVSGSTLSRALQEQVDPAIDARPDVVTVWLAVNDLNARVPLEQYGADLDALLGRLEATHARVLVGNVPDLGRLVAYRGMDATLLAAEVDRWNVVIADTTARHNATLVDLFGRWQEVADHPEYLSADGFHPSAEGYQRLASVFAEVFGAGA
ncbi:MAG TPA: SGNH/GDSL hydrolase family protein [Chloroflexota bacterium]|jgi:lysophospholipase L1-like esterase|nr:SGNH/GDSL hydrolase family protein [Chloroflexota bacterium]